VDRPSKESIYYWILQKSEHPAPPGLTLRMFRSSSLEIVSSLDSTSDIEGRSEGLADQHAAINVERLGGIRSLIGGLG
jgi:hypothetical protein